MTKNPWSPYSYKLPAFALHAFIAKNVLCLCLKDDRVLGRSRTGGGASWHVCWFTPAIQHDRWLCFLAVVHHPSLGSLLTQIGVYQYCTRDVLSVQDKGLGKPYSPLSSLIRQHAPMPKLHVGSRSRESIPWLDSFKQGIIQRGQNVCVYI